MSEHLAVRGLIATTPRHIVSGDGLDIVSFRLVSASRRFDAESGSWKDDQTNWFTVSAFRKLAVNSASSLKKGDRIMALGRLKIRDWDNGERSGTSVEIDADAIGLDLNFAQGEEPRVPSEEEDSEAELQPA
ncbi:MAG: single-stranded DNA-binding protein [Aquiluna sp.]|jgi:single-strand DNA-binding protein